MADGRKRAKVGPVPTPGPVSRVPDAGELLPVRGARALGDGDVDAWDDVHLPYRSGVRRRVQRAAGVVQQQRTTAVAAAYQRLDAQRRNNQPLRGRYEIDTHGNTSRVYAGSDEDVDGEYLVDEPRSEEEEPESADDDFVVEDGVEFAAADIDREYPRPRARRGPVLTGPSRGPGLTGYENTKPLPPRGPADYDSDDADKLRYEPLPIPVRRRERVAAAPDRRGPADEKRDAHLKRVRPGAQVPEAPDAQEPPASGAVLRRSNAMVLSDVRPADEDDDTEAGGDVDLDLGDDDPVGEGQEGLTAPVTEDEDGLGDGVLPELKRVTKEFRTRSKSLAITVAGAAKEEEAQFMEAVREMMKKNFSEHLVVIEDHKNEEGVVNGIHAHCTGLRTTTNAITTSSLAVKHKSRRTGEVISNSGYVKVIHNNRLDGWVLYCLKDLRGVDMEDALARVDATGRFAEPSPWEYIQAAWEYAESSKPAATKPLRSKEDARQDRRAAIGKAVLGGPDALREFIEKDITYAPQAATYLKAQQAFMSLAKTPTTRNIEVVWLYGPAGYGKTWHARTEGAVVGRVIDMHLPTGPNASYFFPGTLGSAKVLLLDNVSETYKLPHTLLLRLTDKFPLDVQIKGSYASTANIEIVYITSIKPPWQVYEEDWPTGELKRRITKLMEFVEPQKALTHAKSNWQ